MTATSADALRTVVAPAIAWLCLCGSASAAAPLPGGRYFGDVEWHGSACHCVRLEVTNDALEFQRYSFVGLEEHRDTPAMCFPDAYLTEFASGTPNRIAPDGYFRVTNRAKGYFSRVVGRFTGGGRRVSGTYQVREHRYGCRFRARASFHARLAGQPARPRPGRFYRCDPIFRSEDLADPVMVFDRGIGCATARDASRHRFADPQCMMLVPGGVCAAGRLFCTAIDRGEREVAAQTRCTRNDGTGAIAELVAWTTCRPRYDIDIQTANVDCREARRFTTGWLDTYDCAATCAVGPYNCYDAYSDDVSITTRCRDRADRRRIIELRVEG